MRSDGWMGACLSREEEITLEPGNALQVRYALYVHHGTPNEVDVAGTYASFAESEFKPCER